MKIPNVLALFTIMATLIAPPALAAKAVLVEQGSYVDDKQDGAWMGYYPDGKAAYEQHYKNGARVGHWAKWFESGKLAEEGNYDDDKRNGTWIEYHADGSKGALAVFDHNQRVGHWMKWFDNGQLAEEGDYRDDKRDGVWIRNYPDGQQARQEVYVLGQRTGTWKKWDDLNKGQAGAKKAVMLPSTPFDLDFESPAPAKSARP